MGQQLRKEQSALHAKDTTSVREAIREAIANAKKSFYTRIIAGF